MVTRQHNVFQEFTQTDAYHIVPGPSWFFTFKWYPSFTSFRWLAVHMLHSYVPFVHLDPRFDTKRAHIAFRSVSLHLDIVINSESSTICAGAKSRKKWNGKASLSPAPFVSSLSFSSFFRLLIVFERTRPSESSE